MKLLIGKKSSPVASFAEASARYQQARGKKPSSRMPSGVVHDDDGREIAWISYNGRVWKSGELRELICEASESSLPVRAVRLSALACNDRPAQAPARIE